MRPEQQSTQLRIEEFKSSIPSLSPRVTTRGSTGPNARVSILRPELFWGRHGSPRVAMKREQQRTQLRIEAFKSSIPSLVVSKVEPKGVPGCCHVVILQFCEGALLAAHAGAASEDG